MPYADEEAGKLSHSWAAGKTAAFAQACIPLCLPKEEQIAQTAALLRYVDVDDSVDGVVAYAIDGSCGEVQMAGGIPGASAMAVAVGGLDFSREQLKRTKNTEGQIDPFAMADIIGNGFGLGFLLPARDLSYKGLSLAEGWAYAMDEILFSEKILSFGAADLLSFLLKGPMINPASFNASIASMQSKNNEFPGQFTITCPSCLKTFNHMIDCASKKGTKCQCEAPLWASDSLGLRTDIKKDAKAATLDAMLAIEKLFAAAILIKESHESQHENPSLKKAVFLDGPLGHGTLAKQLKSLLVALRVENFSFERPWLIGVQKTGLLPQIAALVGHSNQGKTMYAKADEHFLKTAFGKHADAAKSIAMAGSIGEPYILTSKGKGYALWLPEGAGGAEVENAMSMASTMACWLYDNASLPNALAHRISSISVNPGMKSISKIGSVNLTKPSHENAIQAQPSFKLN